MDQRIEQALCPKSGRGASSQAMATPKAAGQGRRGRDQQVQPDRRPSTLPGRHVAEVERARTVKPASNAERASALQKSRGLGVGVRRSPARGRWMNDRRMQSAGKAPTILTLVSAATLNVNDANGAALKQKRGAFGRRAAEPPRFI